MIKVLITGTFDLLHPGHINFIRQALKFGDFLVILVARDKNVVKSKGQTPYFNENKRLENLEKLNLADKIISGDLNDPYKVIREERPDVVALGYDQQTFVSGLIDFRDNSYLHFKIERLEPFKEDICKGKSIRKAVEDKEAGFLLINKEESWTSHDVVAKLRSIIGIKQIGHTGTLDPFATGLLICAIGQATKLVGLFDLLPKTYEAAIRLGVESDTYDRTGVIAQSSKLKAQSLKLKIEEIMNSFVGKQKQLPPMFSAKKVGGKKLYELARKGIEIERKPGEIEIYQIDELGIMNNELRIRVACSAGTYIRTLANDIGQKLGTGAVLWELKRTAIGDFKVSEAVQLSQLKQDNYSEYLIKPPAAINQLNESYARSAWQ